jgi:NADH:ubiquinone oxidoreductase subunit 3 (subunit A)
VATTPGNREIAIGAVLVALILLYVVFDLECALLLGCYFSFFPAFLVGFDGIFVSLIVLLLGIMLLAAGAVRRARYRLPSYIV